MHAYWFTPIWLHKPLFKQGLESHILTIFSQLNPVKPAKQVHMYMFMKGSEQTPPFWQGFELHSFISVSQAGPV